MPSKQPTWCSVNCAQKYFVSAPHWANDSFTLEFVCICLQLKMMEALDTKQHKYFQLNNILISIQFLQVFNMNRESYLRDQNGGLGFWDV